MMANVMGMRGGGTKCVGPGTRYLTDEHGNRLLDPVGRYITVGP